MSFDNVKETVFKFVKRVGDHVIHGSNNNIIILGTDRAAYGPASLKDGLGHINANGNGKGSSAVHIIAGRNGVDPNLKDDSSYIYLSQKTKADSNLNLSAANEVHDNLPAVIVRSDVVRMSARKSVKITVNDDEKHYIFMDKDSLRIVFDTNFKLEIANKKLSVNVGSDSFVMDGTRTVLTSSKFNLLNGAEKNLNDVFDAIMKAINNHDHMTVMGPTTPGIAGANTSVSLIDFQLQKTLWNSK